MRSKMSFRLLVIAALLTVLIPLGVTTPGVHGDGDDNQYPIPEKSELKYPNLGYHLDQLAARVEEGEATAREAARDASIHRDESVAVTIHLSGNVEDVVSFLEGNGGSPRNEGGDYIEAYVPVTLLGQVSEQPGVLRVREIISPEENQSVPMIAGHGSQPHGSIPWNQAGYSGQGIKVGVIDANFGFKGFRDLMGIELPSTVQARCYTDVGRFTQSPTDCENAVSGSIHGTLLAEAVMDIAPEASLYIATPLSLGDLRTAVDWMVSQGVSVIVMGEIYEFDGPGNGTSPFSYSPLRAVDRAVAGGIIWVNAAGNDAQRTWFGPPSVGSFGIMYFSGFDIANDMLLEAGDAILVDMRWDDRWGGATRDFDVCVFHRDIRGIGDCSLDLQSGGAGDVPHELLRFEPPIDGPYEVGVFHYSGSLPGWVQLIVSGDVGTIEHYTGNGSIGNPAESANPGLLAVGAAPWYNVQTIEPYSSRGPTPDGRVKPDIVGADCGATALIPLDENNEGFCGTSQSAPHVAGMAALVRQRFPDYSPVQVAGYLKENAEQRERSDPNNTWGHGFAKLPAVDRAALEALYNATGGDNWLETDNWMTSGALSTWYGVITDSQGRITELNLTSNQLKGELPPELANLANLEVLSLGGNQLTGGIPTELGSLANLQELYLWGNQLTGEIPTELGRLDKLEELFLSYNQLTGTVPAWLGSLANLQELYLWGNQLTGEIPTELGNLTNLERLSLSENQLTGEIPKELGSLVNLEVLALGGNQLTGTVPAWLGSLANLQELYLWSNELIGDIPNELGNLTNLERLSLSENQLTGEIPKELGNLANLEWLSLSENQLTGEIPKELGSLANLEVLALGGNQLTGTVMAWLGSLANLQELYLWGNQLTGEIPTELSNLANLQGLYLSGNQLTGSIPAELGSLTNLRNLWLSDNQLTGQIPSTLDGLASLEILHLRDNQLRGGIPAELGRLTNLGGLDLSRNQLTRGIPSQLGNLTNLKWLDLWENQLTGGIPSELGDLSNLQTLDLSRNELTGSIPAELGGLTSLEWLDLSDNQLTGPIPSELGNLSNLQWLYLSGNQLTGCVPDGLRDVQTNDFGELGLGFCGGTPPVGDPLVVRYDANANGTIEKGEVIAAINDYLFGEGEEAISKGDVIRLINLHLFG